MVYGGLVRVIEPPPCCAEAPPIAVPGLILGPVSIHPVEYTTNCIRSETNELGFWEAIDRVLPRGRRPNGKLGFVGIS